jgi:hypothetical protein
MGVVQMQLQSDPGSEQKSQQEHEPEQSRGFALASALAEFIVAHPFELPDSARSVVTNTLRFGCTPGRARVLRLIAIEHAPHILERIKRNG